jgi:hypothetical protein
MKVSLMKALRQMMMTVVRAEAEPKFCQDHDNLGIPMVSIPSLEI